MKFPVFTTGFFEKNYNLIICLFLPPLGKDPAYPTTGGIGHDPVSFQTLKTYSEASVTSFLTDDPLKFLNFLWQGHVNQLRQIVEFHFAPNSLGTLV